MHSEKHFGIKNKNHLNHKDGVPNNAGKITEPKGTESDRSERSQGQNEDVPKNSGFSRPKPNLAGISASRVANSS